MGMGSPHRSWVWGLCMQRALPLTATSVVVLACILSGNSSAEVPSISPTTGEPFLQIEEFVPGAASVGAEFYAFMQDTNQPKPTTSYLQYVDAADYSPEAVAKHEDPYAAGVTVALGEAANTVVELHAHLVLEPNKTYHYRVVAENSEGRFETPDRTVETSPAVAGALPDGRSYEQVSPVNKSNLDALGNGRGMTMQASPSSVFPSFAFFSFEPFPIAVGTSESFTDYRSARVSSPVDWSTRGVQAPIEPIGTQNGGNTVSGFTEDLAKTMIQIHGQFQFGGLSLGSPGITSAYVRDNATGAYQLLAPNVGSQPLFFVDASRDDSRLLFEAEEQLLPAAAVSKRNLYEWDESKPEGQRLSLAGVLPDAECASLSKPPGCAPPNGSAAGAGLGPAGGEHHGLEEQSYLQNTISEDGAKIFFTAHPSLRLYEREPLDEPMSMTVPVSVGAATFLAATPSGRYVFYAEGNELYRFDTVSKTRESLTSGAENVFGAAGVSDDGTYAYFGAAGVLATNENGTGEKATKGLSNLYEWHEDLATHTAAITFIALADGADWTAIDNGSEGKTSRLTPDGTALLFKAQAGLFLYNADEQLSVTNPVCVSCNPSGAAASFAAGLDKGEIEIALKGPRWTPHLTRNLSSDGNRVFFETAESLVPGDVNGVTDVYEWERGGVGSCPVGENHCLYLISSGTSHTRSFFGDASASGEDVFFFTRQPLAGQDRDLNFDVYDARVGGGIPAQNPPASNCSGEGCRPTASTMPAFGAPNGSIVLTGTGNPVWSSAPKCTKNQMMSHGKCVAIKCQKGRRLRNGKCVKAATRCNRGRGLKKGKCAKLKQRARTRAGEDRNAAIGPRGRQGR